MVLRKSETSKKTIQLNIGRRYTILSAIMGIVIFIYIIKLLSLQVVDAFLYSEQAKRITQRTSIIEGLRGEIWDRDRKIRLATNIPGYTIRLRLLNNPRDSSLFLDELAEILGSDVQELSDRIASGKKAGLNLINLRTDIDLSMVTQIAERIEAFPGVEWIENSVRSYPQGASLAHVLGYTGKIDDRELQLLYNQGYSSESVIGKSGIENEYDMDLRGSSGMSKVTVDALGRPVSSRDVIKKPINGNAIVLTIDMTIQKLIEAALGRRNGAIVVMDPSNGEILGMASYPDFNPNIFSTILTPQDETGIFNGADAPLLNRAIQSAVGPASTFKVVLSAAMLEEKVFDPFQEIEDPGYIIVGNQMFRDHVPDGHGRVDWLKALAESCNTYFYLLGKDYLGHEQITKYSRLFGLGSRTGIDLPGEITGLVPDPGWKQSLYSEGWTIGDTVNLSIGQGYLATTPLQMAILTSAIVNNGIIYKPHVVKEVRNAVSNRIEKEITPEVVRTLDIDPLVFSQLRQGLRYAITDGTPTSVITTDALQVAGKTGTGETGDEDRKHSWFISFGPTDPQPGEQQYVVVVWIDASNPWEWWAPKAANIIWHGIATGQNYEESVIDLQPLWYLPVNSAMLLTPGFSEDGSLLEAGSDLQ